MRENSVFIKLVRVILIFFTVPKQEINVSWRIRFFYVISHTCREKFQQRNSKKKNETNSKHPNWMNLRCLKTKAQEMRIRKKKIWINRFTFWALANEGRQKKYERTAMATSAIIYCFKCILCNFMTFCCGNKMSSDDQCDQWPATNQRSAISKWFRKNMCPNHHINKVDIFTRL